MLDGLEKVILIVAYEYIDQSEAKRIAGSRVWEQVRLVIPDIAPVAIPARLRRLVSQGLLEPDRANSSSRTKVYAPTKAGEALWRELRCEIA